MLKFGTSKVHEVALFCQFSAASLVVQIVLLLEELVLGVRLEVSHIYFECLAGHENILAGIATRIQDLKSLQRDHTRSRQALERNGLTLRKEEIARRVRSQTDMSQG